MARLRAVALLAVLALAGSAAAAARDQVKKRDVTYPTVADALTAEGYTTLMSAIELAGLTDVFGPDFQGTLFAPRDAAFQSLIADLTSLGLASSLEDPTIFAEVLKYHVVSTKEKSADLELVDDSLDTKAGALLNIVMKNGDLAVQDVNGRTAKITKPDIAAGKAIIHGINGVLLPIELPVTQTQSPSPSTPPPSTPSPSPPSVSPSPVPSTGSSSGGSTNGGSSSSSSSSSSSGGGSSSISMGVIIGAVVGAVVVVAGLAFGIFVYRRRSRRRPPVPEKEANGDSGSDQDALKDSLDTFVVSPKTSWAGQASEGPGGGPNSSTQLPLGAAAAEQGSINGGSSFSSGSRDAAPAGNPTTGYAAAAAVTSAVAGAAVGTNPSPAPAGELASLPPLAEDLADGPMATFPTRPAGGPPMSLASLQADGAAAAGPSMGLQVAGDSSRSAGQPAQAPAATTAASQQPLSSDGATPATSPIASREKEPGNEPAEAAALLSRDPLLSYLESQASTPSATSSGTSQLRSSGSQAIVDVKPFEIAWADLTIRQPCGEGSFGKVYLADWFSIQVAAKVLVVGQLGSPGDAQHALTLSAPIQAKLEAEASLLASLRHPHIVNFLGICHEPPCIVTEYCARGSLTQVLATARADPAVAAELTWRRRLSMAVDAAAGMLYLHTRPPPGGPIVHRDLKGPNLLVDASWTVKVTDFNLSRILLDESTQSSSMAAMNPRWLAPEVMGGGRSEPAADVYAFGIIMHELLTWQVPWGTANPWQLVSHVLAGGRLEVPDREALPGPDNAAFGGLDAYVALMKECWAQVPAARPSFQQIVIRLRALLDLAP